MTMDHSPVELITLKYIVFQLCFNFCDRPGWMLLQAFAHPWCKVSKRFVVKICY